MRGRIEQSGNVQRGDHEGYDGKRTRQPLVADEAGAELDDHPGECQAFGQPEHGDAELSLGEHQYREPEHQQQNEPRRRLRERDQDVPEDAEREAAAQTDEEPAQRENKEDEEDQDRGDGSELFQIAGGENVRSYPVNGRVEKREPVEIVRHNSGNALRVNPSLTAFPDCARTNAP